MNMKQQKFLDCLFDADVNGNIRIAMNKAGYSLTTPTTKIVTALYDDILKVSERQMAAYLAEAVVGLGGVIDDPAQIAVKEKIKACTEIMDRTGLSRVDKLNITGKMDGGTVFILPPKDTPEDE